MRKNLRSLPRYYFIVFIAIFFSGTSITTYAQQTQQDGVRLLLVGDPFAQAFQNARPTLESQLGLHLDIEVVGYNDVRTLILRNATDQVSGYDIVSFDVVWMGELARANALLPLESYIEDSIQIDPADFLAVPYTGSQYDGHQFGIPIQPHPELLWYRKDLFEDAGLEPPVTTADVLAAAEALNDPDNNQYGICWNAQRRSALGQQMSHFYAAFGQPLLDENGMPTLDTPAAVEAATYALALMSYSPPDILTMAWDQRTLRFGQGGCAMAYGWGARTFLVEENVQSLVSGMVGYLPAPHAPGISPVTPIGTWSLGIPANVSEDREALAWSVLEYLSGVDTQNLLAENGNGGMPRTSLLIDDTLIARYPSFPVVYNLNERDELQDWMRPAVPQWTQLEEIMGTVFHDMLRGLHSPVEATAEAQRQALALFE